MATVVSRAMANQETSAAAAADTSGRVQACLFNLVVFCQDANRLEYFRQLIQSTIEYFPCRITLIRQLDGEEHDRLVTQNSIVRAATNTSIACDQLSIQSSVDSLYRVAFQIFPFLLPDLPVFLVWDCDPIHEQQILPKLQPYANRLIFDSETVDNMQRFGQRLLDHAHAITRDIVDLNWIRIGGWREILDKIFDTEERIQQLRSAKELRISYNALENRFFHHNQTQAIYLQAWLATQLGWSFRSLATSKEKSEVGYSTSAGEVIVTLQPEKIEDRAPGSIFSFSMSGANGVHYAATRQTDTQQVIVKSSSDETCTLPYTLNLRGTQLTYSFLKEMLYLYGSQHYRHMLHMLKQQDWNRE